MWVQNKEYEYRLSSQMMSELANYSDIAAKQCAQQPKFPNHSSQGVQVVGQRRRFSATQLVPPWCVLQSSCYSWCNLLTSSMFAVRHIWMWIFPEPPLNSLGMFLSSLSLNFFGCKWYLMIFISCGFHADFVVSSIWKKLGKSWLCPWGQKQ